MEWFFTVNKYLKYKGNGQYQIIEIDGRVDPFIVSFGYIKGLNF
jgi:hypothetical protein